MFNLLHKKSDKPSIIVIDGLSCFTSDYTTVDSVWQPQNTTTPIDDILSKTIAPTPSSIDVALQEHLEENNTPTPRQQPLHNIPFDAQEGISGNIWHHGNYYLPTIKGMPERIFELCDISDNEREVLTTQLHTMTATGNTIIAIATGLIQRPIANMSELKHTEKLSFIGFVSVKAPVSSTAKRHISQTDTPVYVVTGQHPTTTYAIVSQLDIITKPGEVFDARRLDVMSSEEVKSTLESARIYARATPAHKKLILDGLNSSGKPVKVAYSATELGKLLAN